MVEATRPLSMEIRRDGGEGNLLFFIKLTKLRISVPASGVDAQLVHWIV
jgi:hypothetical protein